jgi:predicted amidohydrolase YtcJ
MHADGDGAVRAALDGIEALRKALPNADIARVRVLETLVGGATVYRRR